MLVFPLKRGDKTQKRTQLYQAHERLLHKLCQRAKIGHYDIYLELLFALFILQ